MHQFLTLEDVRNICYVYAKAHLTHIAHDAKSHYPDLERAISKYVVDPENLAKIMRGMEIISQAKQRFYESLKQIHGQK